MWSNISLVPDFRESSFDLLVVGAGILGTSSAYHLQLNNPDKKILLVDRLGAAAQANTARSNAMFRNTFSSYDNQILCDSSINFYLDLEKSGFDIGLRKTGYLWLMNERQLSSAAEHVQKMIDNGIELRIYDKKEIENAVPQLRTTFGGHDRASNVESAAVMKLEKVDGAVFGVKCGRLDPDKLANFYLQRFLKAGGKVAFNTSAERLLVEPNEPIGIDGEPFVWQDSSVSGAHLVGEINGDLRAKKVVIACGAWNNELLEPIGVDGHVKAKKRQLFKIPARGDLEALVHNPNFNELGVLPFIILPKSGCFVKAIAENKEFWVGCDDNFGRDYINNPSRDLDDFKAEPSYYEENIHQILREYLPQFENAKPSQMWAGLYSYNTLDYIPFVFEENGLIVVGGDSGSGIMKGDSLGRLVDVVYRFGEDAAEAVLYGGRKYPAKKLGFKSRNVEHEEWVI